MSQKQRYRVLENEICVCFYCIEIIQIPIGAHLSLGERNSKLSSGKNCQITQWFQTVDEEKTKQSALQNDDHPVKLANEHREFFIIFQPVP